MSDTQPTVKRVTLAVCGGVAAYKAAELARLLVKAGVEVTVAMTRDACRFVSPLLFEALTGQRVVVDRADAASAGDSYAHLRLGQEADAVIVAPATANMIAKMAQGIADDEVSTMVLAATAPLIVAPAMNTGMWANPLVQQNLQILRTIRKVTVVEPGQGELACGAIGLGRLADLEAIVAVTRRQLGRGCLDGRAVLITAGPTREAIDPIRFVSNRSTGHMGYALAATAFRFGGTVTLVSGPSALAPPPGVTLVSVESAAEMLTAVEAHIAGVDLVVMTAAVADYRPRAVADQKLKKHAGPFSVEWERTVDILQTLAQRENRPYLVGFCAETENLIENATRKLQQKGCDLLVANLVGLDRGFGAVPNGGYLLDRQGGAVSLPQMAKPELATHLLNLICDHFQRDLEARR